MLEKRTWEWLFSLFFICSHIQFDFKTKKKTATIHTELDPRFEMFSYILILKWLKEQCIRYWGSFPGGRTLILWVGRSGPRLFHTLHLQTWLMDILFQLNTDLIPVSVHMCSILLWTFIFSWSQYNPLSAVSQLCVVTSDLTQDYYRTVIIIIYFIYEPKHRQ